MAQASRHSLPAVRQAIVWPVSLVAHLHPQMSGVGLFTKFTALMADGLGITEAAMTVKDVAAEGWGAYLVLYGTLDYFGRFFAYVDLDSFISEWPCAVLRSVAQKRPCRRPRGV